jgi:phosphoglycolate phosphatase-like HAD superfamily hydrolase
MIETIFLDLDGPLLDGRVRHYRCYADILRAHGFSPMPPDTYWEMKRQRRSRAEQLAVSGAEAIYQDFLFEWRSNIETPEYLELDRVQEGALAKLKMWQERGIAIVLVTMRSNRDTLMAQLRATGLLAYLASVVVCQHEDGGAGKADAVASKMFGVSQGSCLWIGDTEADVEGARKLGCPIWLLSCGLRTVDILLALRPDALSASIVDVDLEKVLKLSKNVEECQC